MSSAVVRPVGCTVKISKMTFEVAYCREMNITFSGNGSVGHSCSQHANCRLPQLETSVALCCVTTPHFRKAFYCPQHKCNDHAIVMITLFNTLLDMPHLSGGWIILAKETFSLTGM